MYEIDDDMRFDSDICINAVFIISQRSVKASVNKYTDNVDIQFANYALRHYQEQLIRECKKEGYDLHMAFVYHQNGTKALDFPDVDRYLTDKENPDYLNIERNKLFCVDHSTENSDAQVSVATLWFLAMNLLLKQEERCNEKEMQTKNRVYFISNRDAAPKEQQTIISNADRWKALNATVTLICGYTLKGSKGINDFDRILQQFPNSWKRYVCYKDPNPWKAKSWIINQT